MIERARILFVAGESGVGKTSTCREFETYSTLLLADRITEAAGPSYFDEIKEGYARWSLWTPELKKPENHARLESAFHEATLKVVGENLMDGVMLVIEGAITGHSEFRVLMLRMLEREFRIRCSDAKVEVFWLEVPPNVNLEYIQKRGRPNESHVTLRDVEQRAARYSAMMKGQIVRRFASSTELKTAGTAFFSVEPDE